MNSQVKLKRRNLFLKKMTYRSIIEKFFYDFNECIFDEHLQILNQFRGMLDEYENMDMINSIHGRHFINCPQICQICENGSNTCKCIQFEMKRDKIINLIETYYKFFIEKINKDNF